MHPKVEIRGVCTRNQIWWPCGITRTEPCSLLQFAYVPCAKTSPLNLVENVVVVVVTVSVKMITSEDDMSGK